MAAKWVLCTVVHRCAPSRAVVLPHAHFDSAFHVNCFKNRPPNQCKTGGKRCHFDSGFGANCFKNRRPHRYKTRPGHHFLRRTTSTINRQDIKPEILNCAACISGFSKRRFSFLALFSARLAKRNRKFFDPPPPPFSMLKIFGDFFALIFSGKKTFFRIFSNKK